MNKTKQKQQILSNWKYTYGVWNEEAKRYEDFKIREESKLISMQIDKSASGNLVLKFLNAPTGFETYRVEDLLYTKDFANDEFCICCGTINSWPSCWVSRSEVLSFLKEHVGENNEQH